MKSKITGKKSLTVKEKQVEKQLKEIQATNFIENAQLKCAEHLRLYKDHNEKIGKLETNYDLCMLTETAHSSRGIVIRSKDNIFGYMKYDGILTKKEARKAGFYSIAIERDRNSEDFDLDKVQDIKYILRVMIVTPQKIYSYHKSVELKQDQDIMQMAESVVPELKVLDSKYQEVKNAQKEQINEPTKKDESEESSQSQPE